jgi:hypothetical protein
VKGKLVGRRLGQGDPGAEILHLEPRGGPRAQIPAAPFTGVAGLARRRLWGRRGGQEGEEETEAARLGFRPLGRLEGATRGERSGVSAYDQMLKIIITRFSARFVLRKQLGLLRYLNLSIVVVFKLICGAKEYIYKTVL